MDNEPDWAKVLDTIYSKDIIWTPNKEVDSEHPVVSEMDIEASTVHDCLAFLSQTKLIDRIEIEPYTDISRQKRR